MPTGGTGTRISSSVPVYPVIQVMMSDRRATLTHSFCIQSDPKTQTLRRQQFHKVDISIDIIPVMPLSRALCIFFVFVSFASFTSAFVTSSQVDPFRKASLTRKVTTDLAMGLTLYGSQGSR